MSSKSVNSIDDRVSYLSDEERFSLVVIAKEEGTRATFRYLWLLAWILIGVAVVIEADRLGDDRQVRSILFVFMAFWAYYFYLILRAVRWQQVGREMLLIKGETLTHKNSFRDFGKAYNYPLANVGPISMREKNSSWTSIYEDTFFSTGTGKLQLVAQGRTLLLGRRIDDRTAEQVMKRFNEELAKRQAQLD